jgi:hypothetical protein
MTWVFIDVPEAEAPMALQAGAKYHRRHQKYFFDSRHPGSSQICPLESYTRPD